ncbi:hypothetical protein JXB28_03540 [Candidatus Woesearchaeota archaeon]|nr:hypothetical protein [Candidatus Woesearchaeota archaeon]
MKVTDYFNQSIDDKLTNEEALPKKSLGKAKSLGLAMALAATLACGSEPKIDAGLKKFYDGGSINFYSNHNSSIIKIEVEGKEDYLYRGPPIKSLFELDDRKLRIIRYVDKRTGAFRKSQAYENPRNNVDKAFLTAKDAQGKRLIRSRAEAMERYMKR